MTEFRKAFLNEEYTLCERLLKEKYTQVSREEIAIIMQRLTDEEVDLEWFELHSDEWAAECERRESLDRRNMYEELKQLYYAGKLDSMYYLLMEQYPDAPETGVAGLIYGAFLRNADFDKLSENLDYMIRKLTAIWREQGWD